MLSKAQPGWLQGSLGYTGAIFPDTGCTLFSLSLGHARLLIPSLGNIIFCLALAADLGADQWDGPRAKLNLCYINSPLIVPCYILLT